MSFFTSAASITIAVLALLIASRVIPPPPPPNSSHRITEIKFSELDAFPIVDAFGPESLTFGVNNEEGPYAGVSDGRIIRWDSKLHRWIDFAFTSPNRELCDQKPRDHEQTEHICGRPLGLRFNQKTGDLYIADAYMGLLVVGPDGGLAKTISREAEGIPFAFTNGMDIDQDTGVVYFTDSSTRFTRRNYMAAIITGDKTGRLMKYDPETKQTTVLLRNLSFPNGVAVSKDGQYVLVAESTTCRLPRYWLETPKAGTVEVFAVLPGFPDNIKRNANGEFWVGMYSKKGRFQDWILRTPVIGEAVVSLPFDAVEWISRFIRFRAKGMAIRLSEEGSVVEELSETSGKLKLVSEVEEKDGNLWFGSAFMPFASVYSKQLLS